MKLNSSPVKEDIKGSLGGETVFLLHTNLMNVRSLCFFRTWRCVESSGFVRTCRRTVSVGEPTPGRTSFPGLDAATQGKGANQAWGAERTNRPPPPAPALSVRGGVLAGKVRSYRLQSKALHLSSTDHDARRLPNVVVETRELSRIHSDLGVPLRN